MTHMATRRLAEHLESVSFDDFDAATVAAAKSRLTDIIGCAIGGVGAPGCASLRDMMLAWGGTGQASVLATGIRLPAADAAMANSIMARSYDFGVLTPYIGDKPVWSHIAETTVPVAVTMAEATRSSGKALLTALILGDDVTTRICAASRYTPA